MITIVISVEITSTATTQSANVQAELSERTARTRGFDGSVSRAKREGPPPPSSCICVADQNLAKVLEPLSQFGHCTNITIIVTTNEIECCG